MCCRNALEINAIWKMLRGWHLYMEYVMCLMCFVRVIYYTAFYNRISLKMVVTPSRLCMCYCHFSITRNHSTIDKSWIIFYCCDPNEIRKWLWSLQNVFYSHSSHVHCEWNSLQLFNFTVSLTIRTIRASERCFISTWYFRWKQLLLVRLSTVVIRGMDQKPQCNSTQSWL